MLYTTQVFDAAVRTANSLHRLLTFDFGMSLGDDCNSSQHNELRWFIDVLDGGHITPSSGTNRDSLFPQGRRCRGLMSSSASRRCPGPTLLMACP
jgi:hypothetical protein